MFCRAELFLATFGRLLIRAGVIFRMLALRGKRIQLLPPATLGKNSLYVTKFLPKCRVLKRYQRACWPDLSWPTPHRDRWRKDKASVWSYRGRVFEPPRPPSLFFRWTEKIRWYLDTSRDSCFIAFRFSTWRWHMYHRRSYDRLSHLAGSCRTLKALGSISSCQVGLSDYSASIPTLNDTVHTDTSATTHFNFYFYR